MVNIGTALRIFPRAIGAGGSVDGIAEDARLDRVFGALSDPIRRRILERLDGQSLLVSELASTFEISLQGVSPDWCSRSAADASADAASMWARSSMRPSG
jgi:hypothetical protein